MKDIFFENWSNIEEVVFLVLPHPFGAHIHNKAEFAYVKSGTFKIGINGQIFTLKEGEAIYINPNDVHYFDISKNDPSSCDLAIFNPAKFFSDYIPYYEPKVIKADEYIIKAFDYITQIKSLNNITKSRLLSVAAVSLLGISCNDKLKIVDKFNQNQNNENEPMRKAITFISEHFDQPISLKELADLCHISYYYFSHKFKLFTGTNFEEYVCLLRIEKAKEQLERFPKDKIAKISLDSGFGSIRHFNRSFKEVVGVSPSEYRKEKLSKENSKTNKGT